MILGVSNSRKCTYPHFCVNIIGLSLVFHQSWTGCLEDWLQLVATTLVDRHGLVLCGFGPVAHNLSHKKTSPVRLPSKFDEKTGPDRTFKHYFFPSDHVVLATAFLSLARHCRPACRRPSCGPPSPSPSWTFWSWLRATHRSGVDFESLRIALR